MAGRTIQVNGASRRMGVDPSSSVSMLQDAITNYGKRADDKRDKGLTALDSLIGFEERNVKQDILKNTRRDVFNQDVADIQSRQISDDYDKRYNSLYSQELDSEGNRNPILSSDPIQNQILADQRKDIENGIFGQDVGQPLSKDLQAVQDIGFIPDSAKGYSDRIYNQMVQSGINPEEADAERKRQLERTQTPGMSKLELAKLNAFEKAETNRTDVRVNTILDNDRIQSQETIREGNGGSSGSNSSGSGRSSYNKSSSNNDINLDDFRDFNKNPIRMYEGLDVFAADTTDDVLSSVKPYQDNGVSNYIINEAMKLSSSVSNRNEQTGQPSINEDGLKNNIALVSAKYGSKSYSPGSGNRGTYGSGKGNSRTTFTKQNSKEAIALIDSIYKEDDKKRNARWNKTTGVKPTVSNKTIESVFGKSSAIDNSKILKNNSNEKPEEFTKDYKNLSEKQTEAVNKVITRTSDEFGDNTTNLEPKKDKDKNILTESEQDISDRADEIIAENKKEKILIDKKQTLLDNKNKAYSDYEKFMKTYDPDRSTYKQELEKTKLTNKLSSSLSKHYNITKEENNEGSYSIMNNIKDYFNPKSTLEKAKERDANILLNKRNEPKYNNILGENNIARKNDANQQQRFLITKMTESNISNEELYSSQEFLSLPKQQQDDIKLNRKFLGK